MLLNVRQSTMPRTASITKNYLAKNVNSAEGKKTYLRGTHKWGPCGGKYEDWVEGGTRESCLLSKGLKKTKEGDYFYNSLLA